MICRHLGAPLQGIHPRRAQGWIPLPPQGIHPRRAQGWIPLQGTASPGQHLNHLQMLGVHRLPEQPKDGDQNQQPDQQELHHRPRPPQRGHQRQRQPEDRR